MSARASEEQTSGLSPCYKPDNKKDYGDDENYMDYYADVRKHYPAEQPQQNRNQRQPQKNRQTKPQREFRATVYFKLCDYKPSATQRLKLKRLSCHSDFLHAARSADVGEVG